MLKTRAERKRGTKREKNHRRFTWIAAKWAIITWQTPLLNLSTKREGKRLTGKDKWVQKTL